MSHIRLFEHPGPHSAFGAACTIAVVGTLPKAGPGAAYEGRLSITGAHGEVSLLSVAGDLPDGSHVTIDNSTQEIVVAWPEYQVVVGSPIAIPNADFEQGDAQWVKGPGWSIVQNDVNDDPNTPSSQWTARYSSQSGSVELRNALRAAVTAGQSITASCRVQQGASSEGNAGAAVRLFFQPDGGAEIMREGNLVDSGSDSQWKTSTIDISSPVTGTVQIGCRGKRHRQNKPLWVDNFAWDLSLAAEPLGTNTEGVIGPITLRVKDAMGCEAEWIGNVSVTSISMLVAKQDSTEYLYRNVPGGGWAGENVGAPVAGQIVSFIGAGDLLVVRSNQGGAALCVESVGGDSWASASIPSVGVDGGGGSNGVKTSVAYLIGGSRVSRRVGGVWSDVDSCRGGPVAIGDVVLYNRADNMKRRSTDGGLTFTDQGGSIYSCYSMHASPTAFFFSEGGFDNLARSTTGLSGSWTFHAAGIDLVFFWKAASSPSRTVVINEAGATTYTDNDGLSWTPAHNFGEGINCYNGQPIHYAQGNWYVITGAGKLYRSPTGVGDWALIHTFSDFGLGGMVIL